MAFANNAERHISNPFRNHTQSVGGRVSKINDAPFGKRSPIIDSYNY